MLNGKFNAYAETRAGKWDQPHANHGKCACLAQIDDEANHAAMLLKPGDANRAKEIITRARNSTTRSVTEMSM